MTPLGAHWKKVICAGVRGSADPRGAFLRGLFTGSGGPEVPAGCSKAGSDIFLMTAPCIKGEKDTFEITIVIWFRVVASR